MRRRAVLLTIGALVLGACGGDDADPRDASAAETTVDGERGWLDDTDRGWSGGDEGGDAGSLADASTGAGGSGASAASPGGPPAPAETQALPGVTAGSVDDNDRWDDYLRYRDEYAASGQPSEALDVRGRRIVTVVDAEERPVLGALVVTSRGGEVVDRARTTADGRALLLVPPSGQQDDTGELAVTVADQAVDLDPEQLEQTVVLDDVAHPDAVRLDLLFLIDATGSMGDEIERLKAHMTSVAEQVAELPTEPDVRFAMTVYRDEGDLFVTRTFDFTADVAAFTDALADVVADGGGDEPEALDEALGEALARPAWRGPDTVKLVVLLADAPPQFGRTPPYVDSIQVARELGVKILPVASSDTSPVAEYVFRQLAQATLGRFSFLTYGADGASPGTSTPLAVDDFEVLSLDALVVRLVTDELAHRG